MIYFAPPHKSAVPYMVAGDLGWIDTPDQCNQGGRPAGVVWIADNGCFGKKVFDEGRWFTWLRKHPDIDQCMFATAPDVVGDHAATLIRSAPWLPKIRALGYPAAFVAQDGAEVATIPWADFDALFIGGTDDFKMSNTALDIAAEAKKRGMWVHVGRVNSRKRYLRFSSVADSADGTFILFGPRIRLPELLGWVREFRNRIPLWEDA